MATMVWLTLRMETKWKMFDFCLQNATKKGESNSFFDPFSRAWSFPLLLLWTTSQNYGHKNWKSQWFGNPFSLLYTDKRQRENTTLKNKLNSSCISNGELDLPLICQHRCWNHIFDSFAASILAAGKNNTQRFSDRFNVWPNACAINKHDAVADENWTISNGMAWLSESKMTNVIWVNALLSIIKWCFKGITHHWANIPDE